MVLAIIRPGVWTAGSGNQGTPYRISDGSAPAGSFQKLVSDGDNDTALKRTFSAAQTQVSGLTDVRNGATGNTIPTGAAINSVVSKVMGLNAPNRQDCSLIVYAKIGASTTRQAYADFSGIFVTPVPNTNGQGIISATRATDPAGGAWTYDDINTLRYDIEWGEKFAGNSASQYIGDIWLEVDYTPAAVLAPTAVTPAASSTVTVPNPAMGATLTASPSGQNQVAEWQFATNSGFTSNVQTVREAVSDQRVSGATTETTTITNLLLTNGTWYVRARGVDEYGTPGPWSAGQSFTVNTPVLPTPTAITPASGATVNTQTPTLGGTLGSDGAGRQQKMEWQLATDSGFTASVRGVIELDADFRASGATTEVVPSSAKINGATTWYLRGRSVGNDGTTSAWTAGQSFTLSLPNPPTPTAVTPADGATVTSNTPTLGATLGAASESRKSKAEWQFSTNTAFTANVRTVTEGSGDLRTSGATTEVIPAASKLFQGTWYMRARAVDEYGQYGSYSATQTLIVAHQPTASPTYPISDQTKLWATQTFTWNFSDPAAGDTQTAYQIIIERNDTGAVLFDTGKIASTTQSRSQTTAGLLKDVKLRWKIRVWDTDDVAGNYSPYQLFTLSDVPAVTVSSPTPGQQVTTGQPTISWTTDANTTQQQRRIVFKQGATTIFDSGTQTSAAESYTPPNTILVNAQSYTVTVTITDTVGMAGSTTVAFTTAYSAPDPVAYTADASGYETNGYINVDWSTQQPDGFFIDWRVYRRLAGTTTWSLLTVIANPSITSYHDWSATTGDSWEYAVSQTGGRSGAILESPLTGSPTTLLADGTHYWLINPYDETDNIRLSNVVGDGYSDDYEEAELIIIGRGRKMNVGTRLGYDGSLKAQLRDDLMSTARAKRIKLQLIKEARTTYLLRNPFGDLVQVSMGSLQVERIAGVGTSEFCDVTIPYKEVF